MSESGLRDSSSLIMYWSRRLGSVRRFFKEVRIDFCSESWSFKVFSPVFTSFERGVESISLAWRSEILSFFWREREAEVVSDDPLITLITTSKLDILTNTPSRRWILDSTSVIWWDFLSLRHSTLLSYHTWIDSLTPKVLGYNSPCCMAVQFIFIVV